MIHTLADRISRLREILSLWMENEHCPTSGIAGLDFWKTRYNLEELGLTWAETEHLFRLTERTEEAKAGYVIADLEGFIEALRACEHLASPELELYITELTLQIAGG